MRIIIYTGKGGVGKTTIASATAMQLAKKGYRTLVMSTDSAHSLSDSLDIDLGSEPVHVSERLWGVEVDNLRETEKYWGAVNKWLSGVMSWAKLNDVATEEMFVLPGTEELFSLMRLKEYAMSGRFDVIVVDCAPTGETLRLLSYPALLSWWLEKIFPVERRLVKVARPVARVMTGGLELPDNKTLDSLGRLVSELQGLQKIILDEEVASIRLVLNPEKMVVAEARRTFTYLNLFGFNTDAIIVNRVLPAEAGIGYWSQWRQVHEKYEREIRACFSPLPILRVPMMESEVHGALMLNRVADVAFSDANAEDILYRGQVHRIRRDGNRYVLEISLPFIDKGQLHLGQKGDELTVQVGQHRHKVLLPRTLQNRDITGARFYEQKLAISFDDKAFPGTEGENHGQHN